MEAIRKFHYIDPQTGREICYVEGSKIQGGKVRINKIHTEIDEIGRDVAYIYVCNKSNESCKWKKIVVLTNNVIEIEYDWKEILGYE